MTDLARDMETLSIETRPFAASTDALSQDGGFDASKTHPTSKLRFTSMPKAIPTLVEHSHTILIEYDPRSPTYKQGPRTQLRMTFDGSRPWLLGQASDQQVAEMLWKFWPFHRMDDKWDSEKKAETVKQRIEFEVETRAEK
ncbi:hypothetical protein JCM24511_09774 [Saitozyma sp. JCM 24511]|nr:hypothetical protein JCM24511_09774 [Saitozyma sp. JCM 24511]